jgi:hypothetical protein
MIRVYENKYVKDFQFSTKGELSKFLDRLPDIKILELDNSYGDTYHCYIFYHALSKEKEFVIVFSTYGSSENLQLLFWDKNNLVGLENGAGFYLININKELTIRFFCEFSTPFIGFYTTSNDNVIILEECALKLINSRGEVLQDKFFNLIENFEINNNQLILHTEDGVLSFEI